MAQLEYICSALSHCGLDHKDIFENKDVLAKINSMLASCQDQHNHKVGLLFNAFTEKTNGPKLKQYTGASDIMSDSGGLQIITTSAKIDDSARKKIYKVQADYSDIAMSFDEMPLELSGDKSSKLDTGARKFDSKRFEEMSRQSGKNLHEQINFFLDEKTTCRPLVILHGNDITWYQKNLDFILDEIPQDKWQYIAGVSCGSGAMGFGDLENIERTAVMAFLEGPDHLKKKFHILGVGSLSRMMPVATFIRNGAFDPDVHISYDSSSLTMSFTLGFYHFDDYWCKSKLSTQYDKMFVKMYKDVSTKSKALWNLDINQEDLYKLMCEPKGGIDHSNSLIYLNDPTLVPPEKESNRGTDPSRFILNAAVLFNSVMNFNKIMNDLITSKKEYNRWVGHKTKNHVFQTLAQVKTLEDFHKWKQTAGRDVKSQRILDNDIPTVSVHDF